MSASPAGHTPGRTHGQTPNGGSTGVIRRRKQADPMVRPKKRGPKPIPANNVNGTYPNGNVVPLRGPGQVLPHHVGKTMPPSLRPSPPAPPPLALLEGSDVKVSGFSDSPQNLGIYHDYELVTTKKSLMQGLRHHVLKLASKRAVDLTDEQQFLRPVRLHRRDPRFNPADGEEAENEEEREEREKREKAREDKEKQKELDERVEAPPVDGPIRRKVPFGKRVQPVYRNNQTDAQKTQSKLKYEETLPWHLEDDENKNVWIGHYEQALSGEYAAFAFGADGKFRLIPIEKWYRFTPKNKFKPLTVEEAEKKMNAKVKKENWEKEAEAKEEARRIIEKDRSEYRVWKGKVGGASGASGRPSIKTESEHVDELDFEEDQFADDEEAPIMEGVVDAEEKETQTKIKREQLEANVFDMRDENDYEREEMQRQRERRLMKETGKKVKKTIVKREKNLMYDSRSDNPYSSSESESEDTEAEMLKAEERKKEAERKANASDQERAKKSKAPSEASSRGTNTPSGRPSKHQLLSVTSNSLKRPGSPNISEASGNESSRKKHRKFDGNAGSQPIQPPSRPGSPNLLPPSSSVPDATRPPNSRNPSSFSRPLHSNAGSGSEGEAAGSGGEMSDGTRRKQTLKLKMGSKRGTPQGSRAASPERAPATVPPARTATPVNASDPNERSIPTAEELRAKIPPEGINLNALLNIFNIKKGVDSERKTQFTKLMRANSRWDSTSKLLKPLH